MFILICYLASLQITHIITFSIVHHHNKASDLPKYKYNYYQANWADMNQYLYSCNFSQIFNSRDVEFIWEQLKVPTHNATNMFVPKVPIKNINQPRWFTPFIRHKVKCLRTQKRKYEKHPTELNKSKVDKIASELHLAMAEAKSDYESNLIFNFAHTHNNKIYQYISNIKGHDNFTTQI